MFGLELLAVEVSDLQNRDGPGQSGGAEGFGASNALKQTRDLALFVQPDLVCCGLFG
jgi:hypothetical protein